MREKVTAVVKNEAEKMGYAFGTGFGYRINQTVTGFPFLWMSPPKLVGCKGRKEGRADYHVTLQLMWAGAKKTAAEKESTWAVLERDAVKLIRGIEKNNRVAEISDLQCVPGEMSLTNHGELSMEVSFRIGIAFCSCEI